ncbi:MAG: hypothetical protein LBP65_03420 [Puniceicoccales bacterium]|nr:hypothetical protein [Puniceicoccales bacterium]
MNQLKELGAIQFSYRKRRNGEQNLSLCPREVWRYVRSGAPYYSIRVFEQKFIEVEQLFKDTIADIDSKDDDHPETHDGPEKAGSQTRRTLTLNLVVKEVDDWTRETLCLVCNGKETVLKTFNTTAAKAATIYVLKNPGRVITLQELLNNCKDLEAIKAPRVNDLIRVWPENDDFMKEFIRRVFFRKLSHKDVYFLGKQVITLP